MAETANAGAGNRVDEDIPVLSPGAVIAPGYTVVEHVSRGDALDVYEVFSAERLSSCIAKTIRPDRAHVERVRARLLLEGELLQTLSHPLLLRGFETIVGPNVVVIVETVPGLPLDDVLYERARRLPITDLCHLGRHLTSATHYLHHHGYLHLDIRPSNVMAHGGLAKLIDLSLARPPGPVPRGLGSREYLAPEQARGGNVSAATDVWGIGVTLYEGLTCVRPFDPLDEDEEELVGAIKYLQLRRPAPPIARWRRRVPQGLVSLINACLDSEPEGRPTIAQLWESLGGLIHELDANHDPD